MRNSATTGSRKHSGRQHSRPRHSARSHSARRPRPGFVLLSVLVILVLVGVIMARMASQGVRLSLAAKTRTDQLQRDWSVQSLERIIAPQSRKLFEERVKATGSSPRTMSGSVQLGGRILRLTVADETAKLNVNRIHFESGIAGTDAALKRSVPSLGEFVQQLRPIGGPMRPTTAEPNEDERAVVVPNFYRAWGQLYDFEATDPRRRGPFVAQVSNRITLWGQGTLNYVRCDRNTLEILLQQIVDNQRATELADEFHANPKLDLQAFMLGIGIDEEIRDRVLRILTKESTCFSLQTEILPEVADTGVMGGQFASVTILNQPTMIEESDTSVAPVELHRYELH